MCHRTRQESTTPRLRFSCDLPVARPPVKVAFANIHLIREFQLKCSVIFLLNFCYVRWLSHIFLPPALNRAKAQHACVLRLPERGGAGGEIPK